MATTKSIIDNGHWSYETLLCYQKAVVIYDLTYHFCRRFISPRDRTYDQMIQAARSGKQNIVEGTIDKASSYEMCLKLLNVARGSLKELLEDYKDYLRVNGHKVWSADSVEVRTMRRIGIENSDPEYFLRLAESRSDSVIANMAIVLIYQADTLIMRYIKSVEDDFMQHGGVKERLYKLRTETNNN